MQISGTAAPGAARQAPRKMRFRSSSKRCRFFVSHMNPLDLLLRSNRVRNAVERVAGNAVNLTNSCLSENLHQQVRYLFPGHRSPFLPVFLANGPSSFRTTFIRFLQRVNAMTTPGVATERTVLSRMVAS